MSSELDRGWEFAEEESATADETGVTEILTDNGPQYVTWRGKSQFSRELEQQGICQVVSRPKHPQTLGKIERFWGTLWRECLQRAVFLDLEDARRRIGLFIDYYNFRRPHQGLEGLTPADRFFDAAPTVLQTLKERVAPKGIDLVHTPAEEPEKRTSNPLIEELKAETTLGIYELKGDDLKICLAKPGAWRRPTTFRALEGYDTSVITLKRFRE